MSVIAPMRSRVRGPLPPIAGGAGYAFVRAAGSSSQSTAPGFTWAAAPGQGNLLICGAFVRSTIAVTMSSSGWTPLTLSDPPGFFTGRMWWKIAGASESTTVALNAITNSYWAMSAAEYSFAGVNGYDSDHAGTTTTTTPATVADTPAAGKNALIVCFMASGNGGTWSNLAVNSSATGVNQRGVTQNGTNRSSVLFDATTASTSGSYTGSATSPGGTGVACIAAFTIAANAASASDTVSVSDTAAACTPVFQSATETPITVTDIASGTGTITVNVSRGLLNLFG